MTETLKVGVIGAGYTASVHIPGWMASPYSEVVAICDLDPVASARLGEKHQIKRLVEQAEELINDPDIDVIDVCVPNSYHTPLTIAALDAGKHVLCEKPLAATPAEVQQMIAARDRSGKLLMTAQHQRFRGEAKALKAEIDAGRLGEVYHARGWMLRRAGVPTRPGFIYKQHASGGACIDIGVHILDLTLWMMGNPEPVAVTGVARSDLMHKSGAFSAWAGAIPEDVDVEEFAAAMVRFDNGATLMLEVSWMLHHNTPGEDMQMWLYGKEGGAHFPSLELYYTDNERQQMYNTALKRVVKVDSPHAAECMAFAEAIATGAPSPVPAEQSLQVMKILDGIYRSQETGREIRLDEA